MIVYLTEQGSQITIAGERLIVAKDGQKLMDLLTKDLDQIVIMGNISISTQALKFMLKKRIDTVFTTLDGRYLGRLVSEFGKNIELRKEQFKVAFDETLKFMLAKNIVYQKIYNMRQVIRKLNYYHKQDEVVKRLHLLTVHLKKVAFAKNKDELLGIEGIASNIYFECFDYLITNKSLKFVKRTRRPPENEFNALLSFAYTLLMNVVRGFINIVGLDPYLGVYHSDDYGKPSLVLDLMEEYRSVAVDYMIISAVNKMIFNIDDFVKNEDEELPVKLTIFGKKKLISLFEKRLKTEFFNENTGRKESLRKIMRYQTYLFSKALIDKTEYKGFKLQ
ncbi:CRISPR-associated endonuclease Cas1 [Deferribacter abyssi]|uniref:CRISPR-associated endonuclease Cas1 n=1 Tax=Deferribacter abyssi TaxID=213806 RepID=UPI003C28ACB8